MKKPLYRFICLFAITLMAFSAGAFAQETGAAPAIGAEAVDDGTLLSTFKQGGIAMYPLLLFSVATVWLTIYNAISIREKAIVDPEFVHNTIIPELQSLDLHKARDLCEKSEIPTVKVLHCGLETTKTGHFTEAKMEQAFNDAASLELSKPLMFINYLQVIASVSPMIGLLGTVSGMVKAFRTIAQQGMGRPELLADNISEALVTTASGLIVAIPALLAYFFFKNKYAKIASGISLLLGECNRTISDAFLEHQNRQSSES